jgi:hypothetical protein
MIATDMADNDAVIIAVWGRMQCRWIDRWEPTAEGDPR